jgi:gamma-glutamylcyclotransferase (GGCT)/AIG2-like uncharacterized protein YtfP
MIYFAYGSNIDPFQMRHRCRSAQILGPGRLDGYRLHFPRHSFIRNSAVASIEPVAGWTVWGALYAVLESDLERLDACEGYRPGRKPAENSYYRIAVEAQNMEGNAVGAMTYRANPMAYASEPSRDYLGVIIRAAISLGLPEDYIGALQARPGEEAAA